MAGQLRSVGKIGKPHGLRGEVSVEVRTDSPDERFAEGVPLLAQRADGEEHTDECTLTVAAARNHSGRLLVRFRDIDDRAAAEKLRGMLLFVDPAQLPPIDDPDEFYDHELEGLAAVMADGSALGQVREVVHGRGGDLLAIEAPGREVLVPFVRQFVPEVRIAHGRVVIDPPEGLLDP